jgi:hypothetical protein
MVTVSDVSRHFWTHGKTGGLHFRVTRHAQCTGILHADKHSQHLQVHSGDAPLPVGLLQ